MSFTRDMVSAWELRAALDASEVELTRLRTEVEKWKGAHAFCEERIDNCAIELNTLRAEVEKWKKLDREAATHVESVICMKSNRFTTEPPYVGWKGLGLALTEDYDELSRLRAEVESKNAALRAICEGDIPRPVAKPYRADGTPSKNDQCEHGQWMYEECGQCIEQFARDAQRVEFLRVVNEEKTDGK